MPAIEVLHGDKEGLTCNLVAHGESMRDTAVPVMMGDETICVNVWRVDPDYLIFVDVFIRDFILRMGRRRIGIPDETRIISSQMCKVVADYWFDTYTYFGQCKTGLRALHMALAMGYDKVYLYGYDFIKVDEDAHQGKAHLQKYLDGFNAVDWPAGRIVQTNPQSRLQF